MGHSLVLLLAIMGWGNGDAPFRHADGGAVLMPATAACLDQEARARIRQRLQPYLQAAGKERGESPPALIYPVRQNPAFRDLHFWVITNYVDHDPLFPDMLADYQGGERTYDTTAGYNHAGTDFFLWPFGWEMMDQDQAWVVAAAAGTIIGKDDGNFDRNCTLPPPNPDWNGIYIQHKDGSVAWYGHLKAGSLTEKAVGESVEQGEFLAVVGSSGVSTGPHLHFGIYDAADNLNDPYRGPFNQMNSVSWWLNQPDYYLPAIVRLMTHEGAPSINSFCPEDEIIDRADEFMPGDRIHTSVFYRDQQAGQITDLTLFRPDGSTFAAWTHDIPEAHLAASFWTWFWDLPQEKAEGAWRFRATFEGQTMDHTFVVGPCDELFQDLRTDWPNVTILAMIPLAFCSR
ncbi:MAG: peptidoglycan DD-metalloendopeptidase family protein [Acidobacteriota bacterium]|nr:peptidoglycan DD-metalloendopeptidase family protein [Acidobacteriota bacterium]